MRHLEKYIQEVSSFVAKTDSIEVLQIDSENVFSHFRWCGSSSISRIDHCEVLSMVGKREVIIQIVAIDRVVLVFRVLDGRR